MIGSQELIDRVLDRGSWESWDAPLPEPSEDADGVHPVAAEYRAQIAEAQGTTGLDEAVVSGQGRIAGHRVAVLASEFGFLAGSVGMAASARILAAIERATRQRLPLVASPASGGTRLQEGTIAFVQMTRIAAAIAAHRASGTPYLVYLRHPTTGGVLASWGSLGHVTAAEPGALIGLLGPRVQQVLHGAALPDHVQRAENLYAHGLIDAVVPPEDLREVAIRVLNVTGSARELHRIVTAPRTEATEDTGARGERAHSPAASSWDAVLRSRRPDRPSVRALLKIAAADVTPLSGTTAGERDDALILALARFGRAPCVVLGQDRRTQTGGRTLGPGGLREAIRGMRLAAELGLPLVTVVDTPGAAPNERSEQTGLAGGIAQCLYELATLPTPTLCVLLGQGGGGTALALVPADRVLCAANAWLAPLPPEGASEVLFHTASRAPEVADLQGVGAASLLRDGIADRVVPEYPDAADEPVPFMHRLGAALEAEITELARLEATTGPAARTARYRPH